MDRFAIIRALVERLTATPSIVVVDESELLASDCVELLRYLHDHGTTRFALVLVGGNGLARSLLAALGKGVDFAPQREPLWRLVGVHLRAERVRDLIVVRAHTLTYPALRRVADHASDAGVQLWLVVTKNGHPRPLPSSWKLCRTRPHRYPTCSATAPLSPNQTSTTRCRPWRPRVSVSQRPARRLRPPCRAALCASH